MIHAIWVCPACTWLVPCCQASCESFDQLVLKWHRVCGNCCIATQSGLCVGVGRTGEGGGSSISSRGLGVRVGWHSEAMIRLPCAEMSVHVCM